MDALNSLQLGDLDWTAWASVGTLLHEHKNTLKTLVLCMSIMDEENVEGKSGLRQIEYTLTYGSRS